MASSENSKVQGLGNVHRKEDLQKEQSTLKIQKMSDSEAKHKEEG